MPGFNLQLVKTALSDIFHGTIKKYSNQQKKNRWNLLCVIENHLFKSETVGVLWLLKDKIGLKKREENKREVLDEEPELCF